MERRSLGLNCIKQSRDRGSVRLGTINRGGGGGGVLFEPHAVTDARRGALLSSLQGDLGRVGGERTVATLLAYAASNTMLVP